MAVIQIFAVSTNHVLGRDNGLAWHLPKDMKFFKTKTAGHVVVMGRKTYQSLGKALPHRTNIVVSNQPDFVAENCIVTNSVDDALNQANQKQGDTFIIGGAQIFDFTLDATDKIYLTEVHGEVDGNVFYDFDKSLWREVAREDHFKDEKHAYDYSFVELVRK